MSFWNYFGAKRVGGLLVATQTCLFRLPRPVHLNGVGTREEWREKVGREAGRERKWEGGKERGKEGRKEDVREGGREREAERE